MVLWPRLESDSARILVRRFKGPFCVYFYISFNVRYPVGNFRRGIGPSRGLYPQRTYINAPRPQRSNDRLRLNCFHLHGNKTALIVSDGNIQAGIEPATE